MVGNIRDMKALIATRQPSPSGPTKTIAPIVQSAAMQPKNARSLRELMYFISIVAMKRKHRNIAIAMILYFCAVALSMPRLSAYWMMKVQTMICAPT